MINFSRLSFLANFHHAFAGIHHAFAGVHLVWLPFHLNSRDNAVVAGKIFSVNLGSIVLPPARRRLFNVVNGVRP